MLNYNEITDSSVLVSFYKREIPVNERAYWGSIYRQYYFDVEQIADFKSSSGDTVKILQYEIWL